MIKLFPKQLQSAHDRRTGHVDERAISLAPVEIDDLLKLVEEGRIAFAEMDTFEHRGKHRRLHSASRTLSARLAREELREPESFCNHARAFGIETHHAATKRRAGLLQRFRIECNIELIRK